MKRTPILVLSSALLTACPLLAEPPATRPVSVDAESPSPEKLAQQKENAKQAAYQKEYLGYWRPQFISRKARYDQAVEAIAKLKQLVRTESGLPNITGLPGLMRDLQSQRETLFQEESAAKGRRAGLEAAIANLSKQAAQRGADDALMKELNAVIEARQLKVDRLKTGQKAGIVAAGDMDEAVAELALARANAAAAQQRLTSGSSDAIDSWNREMMNLNIAGQEREARMLYIERRLHDLEAALKDQDRVDAAANQLHFREQPMLEARKILEDMSPDDPILQK